jgi:glyoxylase-like metal-dependent hydrolase (beta-lactamase superfamily II)
MKHLFKPAAATALALLLAACASTQPDAPALIRQAEQALGGAATKTLVISGSGSGASFGQAYRPGMAWPGLQYGLLTRAMNFETGAFREDFARSRNEPNGGGAVPLLGQGEARGTGYTRDGYAWSPTANGGATAAGVAVLPRVHDLWTGTPQGALKAAARHGAVAGTRTLAGIAYHTLSYTAPGQYTATLLIDNTGSVARIESTMPHPVLGDTPVVTEFSAYKDWGGIRFPSRIQQSQGGFPVLDIAVTEVQAGAAVDIEVPAAAKAGENVSVEKVAEGVWFLAGGSHNSVAIEQSSQIVLVESPLYDGRAAAVLARANQLVPGKQVQTVINSHHHFDHAGGLRTAVATGAQLITSAMAKPYFEKVFANPNRIAPDLLAQAGNPAPRIVGVSGQTALNDSMRRIEIHEMQGSVHAQGFMLVWLPAEKLLIEADAYTPGPPNSPPPAVPNGNQVNLVQNFERLGLAPERILPLHGRVATSAELYVQIGRQR